MTDVTRNHETKCCTTCGPTPHYLFSEGWRCGKCRRIHEAVILNHFEHAWSGECPECGKSDCEEYAPGSYRCSCSTLIHTTCPYCNMLWETHERGLCCPKCDLVIYRDDKAECPGCKAIGDFPYHECSLEIEELGPGAHATGRYCRCCDACAHDCALEA